MNIKNFRTASLSIISACALLVAPLSVSYAADAVKKETKQMSCKQEAKQKGIKDKAEKKQYIADCEKARKEAKKQNKEGKK